MENRKEVQKMLEDNFGFSLTMTYGEGTWISGTVCHHRTTKMFDSEQLRYSMSVNLKTEEVQLFRHTVGLVNITSEFTGISDINRLSNMLLDFEEVLSYAFDVHNQSALFREHGIAPVWKIR